MSKMDYSAIGLRIRALKKKKGLGQTRFAKLLDKSLRIVQKYETGEIGVSFSVVNQVARVLGATVPYILGTDTDVVPIRSLADILDFLLELERVSNLNSDIDVKKPPRDEERECSISFKGKDLETDHNAGICLFLEEWENER